MRLLFSVTLGVMLLACPGLAQENNTTAATDALQEVLSSLKQSVEKLSIDNDQWSAQDKVLQGQVAQLQMQLGRLEAQGNDLNKAVAGLQDNNPPRSSQIIRLQEENFDLDDRIRKAQAGIKLTQQSLDAGYQQAQEGFFSPESKASVRLQKEKLRLMKMIYDSQLRQGSLHESILEYQKSMPLPAVSAVVHQQSLKKQIKDLETQIAAYPPQKASAGPGSSDQWEDAQLRQLELELKILEKNYVQLKDLMEKMSKKAQETRITVSQHVEGDKLQSSMDDLNRQGVGLRTDLDDLRAQMIQLDKRKSSLEMMIQQSP